MKYFCAQQVSNMAVQPICILVDFTCIYHNLDFTMFFLTFLKTYTMYSLYCIGFIIIIITIDAFDQCCLWCILNIAWSEHVTNFEVRRHTGQPLLSDTVWTRHLKLFGHVARAEKSQDHSRALQACISPALRNWRRHPGHPRHTWLRTVE